MVARHQINLEVSMFCYDQNDAEQLATMIRDRVDTLLGGGQALVRVAKVAPVTGEGLFNQEVEGAVA